MRDLEKFINRRKRRDAKFAQGFEAGYSNFKVGVLLKQAREKAGLTQDEVARKFRTKKSAIFRMENHAEDSPYPRFRDTGKHQEKELGWTS